MLGLANSSPPLTTASSASAEASTADHQQPSQPPPKKKRNQPGMPDPESEVVALSPKTLMATNRFVCEICGKGFQRDQNLQLHRRGHNLPWKLRQRGTTEVKRRVYVCPETSCVHHDPKRALGDLTGIKKHFCRKHGEKKWKCERCSKKYAVQSDWKAHMKTCGTKEYKCDCGTIFSRRDSFVTHRAFCDALAQETVKVQVNGETFGGVSASGEQRNGSSNCSVSAGSPPAAVTALSSSVRSPVLSIQSSDVPETPNTLTPPTIIADDGACGGAPSSSSAVNGNMVFGSVFAPLSGLEQHQPQASQFSTLIAAMSSSSETQHQPPPLSLSSLYQFTHNAPALFHNHHQFHQPPPPQPAMSATALLQKAAQIGATTSPSSLLWGFGLSSSTGQHNSGGGSNHGVVKDENGGGGIGPGLPLDGDFMGFGPMMNGPDGMFARPTTLDLLGLGMGPSSGSPNVPSSLLTPFSEGLGRIDEAIQVRSNVDTIFGESSWEGPSTRKRNHTVP